MERNGFKCHKVGVFRRENGKVLFGEYYHNIDDKSRLIIPQKLREDLGDTFVVFPDRTGCLLVMSETEWAFFYERLLAKSKEKDNNIRVLARLYFPKVRNVSPDKQGRIPLTAELKEAAGLSRNVAIIGVGNRVELWDADHWKEWTKKTTDDMGENMENTWDEALGF